LLRPPVLDGIAADPAARRSSWTCAWRLTVNPPDRARASGRLCIPWRNDVSAPDWVRPRFAIIPRMMEAVLVLERRHARERGT
jgi:hypothetical protein